jgi:hypothetical protein
MSMKKLAAALIGVAIAAATFTVHTGTASAATKNKCSVNYICFYTADNATGFALPTRTSADKCMNLPKTWNDSVKSIHNNTGHMYMVYQHANCKGGNDVVYAKSTGNMNWYWDTQMSSYMRIQW